MTPYEAALIAEQAYIAKPDIGVAESASRAIVRPQADGSVVIAFPGTDNHESFLADIDVLTVSTPYGELHRGFWEAWSAIATDVGQAIDGRPWIPVGHSLGAALAIIADLVYPSVQVYGFEPPRVSPHALPDRPRYLTRNGNDAITDVPLGWPTAGPLTQIGHARYPLPNIDDHFLAGVIAALKPAEAAVA